MMGAIDIDMGGLQDLQSAWAVAPAIVREELEAAMIESDLLIEREVKERTPVGASAGGAGGLKGSIFSQESVGADNVIGVVGTALNYATPVELGTRPHFPPVDALIDWVMVKLQVTEQEARGVAFMIARKIAARGTEGAHMFEQGFAAVEQQVYEIFGRARDRIVMRVATAGAPGLSS
jgi:hypothetical protein